MTFLDGIPTILFKALSYRHLYVFFNSSESLSRFTKIGLSAELNIGSSELWGARPGTKDNDGLEPSALPQSVRP